MTFDILATCFCMDFSPIPAPEVPKQVHRAMLQIIVRKILTIIVIIAITIITIVVIIVITTILVAIIIVIVTVVMSMQDMTSHAFSAYLWLLGIRDSASQPPRNKAPHLSQVCSLQQLPFSFPFLNITPI